MTKHGPVEKRKERPLILLSSLREGLLEEVVALAREWGWDLRANWITGSEWPEDKPVSGAVIGDLPSAPFAKLLLRKKVPAVRLGNLPHPADKKLPALLPDHVAFGRMAAEHFADRGFPYVAYVGHDPCDRRANTHALFSAFRDRAVELGMHCNVLSLTGVASGKESRQTERITAMADWLNEMQKPIGVFSYADHMMVRVLMACDQAGLAVPEEVALLGMGNRVFCELTRLRLSSIQPDERARITAAFHLLRRLIEGGSAPKDPILIPPKGIIERASTNVLAVPDPAIARALRFIWEHFDQNISIQEVADAVGVPRRSLERGFRRHFGRSVHDELVRKRVEELRQLLLGSGEPLAELAPRAGFFTLANAHKCFRRVFGTSPGRYRREHAGSSLGAQMP